MQRILLIRFLKTVFHVVTKGEKRGYRGSGGRMGLGEDVILRFFFRKWIVLGCRMIIFVKFLRQKKCREQKVEREKVLILFPQSVFL